MTRLVNGTTQVELDRLLCLLKNSERAGELVIRRDEWSLETENVWYVCVDHDDSGPVAEFRDKSLQIALGNTREMYMKWLGQERDAKGFV